MRDTLIASKLRGAGLKVVEVAGWQNRGSDNFNPKGFVWHHTAGPAKGNAPSLAICTNGRSGLPGPLCNVFQARDNTIYVVAAGRANHAGSGGWAGLSGNSSVYGVEIENIGTSKEPWRADQIETACKVAAALAPSEDRCCHHKEWATPKGRKIDMHTVSGQLMRARVKELLLPPKPTEPLLPLPIEGEEDVPKYIQDSVNGDIYTLNWENYRKLSKKQFDQRNFLAALGGKPIKLEKQHPWVLADFVMKYQLIELKAAT